VHQFHLGLWFNSPTAANAAHCGNTVTPFNGEHNAGVQALRLRPAITARAAGAPNSLVVPRVRMDGKTTVPCRFCHPLLLGDTR